MSTSRELEQLRDYENCGRLINSNKDGSHNEYLPSV